MKEFEKSIELARALWQPNYENRCQHFSFAFYKGRVLGIGRNKSRTHPVNLRNPVYFNGRINEFKGICSELSLFLAIKSKTNIPFSKLVVVNVRIDKNLSIKMSRPCLSCSSLLAYLKPKKLYFTNSSGGFELY